MSVVNDVDRQAFARKVAAAAPFFDAQFGHAAIERIRAYKPDPTLEGAAAPTR